MCGAHTYSPTPYRKVKMWVISSLSISSFTHIPGSKIRIRPCTSYALPVSLNMVPSFHTPTLEDKVLTSSF